MEMLCIDQTFETAHANLAYDEILLDHCEDGHSEAGFLRFWSASTPFVVVGYSNRVSSEVNVDSCQKKGIPIYRRCSGGGTILQDIGCLSYALVLRIDSRTETIPAANRFIMEQQRIALTRLMGGEIEVQGITDLTIGNRKFSGNAQRRKRTTILFHGTILLQMSQHAVADVLRFPSHQPDYRRDRTHEEFLTCLAISEESVKAALMETWNATRPALAPACEGKVLERYRSDEWNMKF